MVYVAIILLNLYVFFILYVASMGMVAAYKSKRLNWFLWVLCLPFVAIALLVDVLNNILVFSILFFELPKELTVTARLKRHVTNNTKRGKFARWLAVTLLNPFDYSGNHVD